MSPFSGEVVDHEEVLSGDVDRPTHDYVEAVDDLVNSLEGITNWSKAIATC